MSRGELSGRRGISPATVCLLLLLLVALYLYQSGRLHGLLMGIGQRAGVMADTLVNPPPGERAPVQVFFTTPSLVYPDLPQQRPPSPLLDALLADIDAARGSVDLAAFDLDLADVTDALLRAQARRVDVRVVVDSENLETPEVSEQAGRLQRAGIPIQFDRREGFMHDKIVILDRAVVWTGSWNVTENDTFRNNNNMLRLASRQVAAEYTREFEQMFGGRFGKGKTSAGSRSRVRVGASRVTALFSPADGVANDVLGAVRAAKSSIHFMAFSYTAKPIAEAMIARSEAGILVRGVVETQNATGSGAAFGSLRASGIDVLLDGNCYILHHKAIIIDERIVITGSYNFTNSAERDNDENLVIVDDPRLARAYLDEFDRVYAQAREPSRCR